MANVARTRASSKAWDWPRVERAMRAELAAPNRTTEAIAEAVQDALLALVQRGDIPPVEAEARALARAVWARRQAKDKRRRTEGARAVMALASVQADATGQARGFVTGKAKRKKRRPKPSRGRVARDLETLRAVAALAAREQVREWLPPLLTNQEVAAAWARARETETETEAIDPGFRLPSEAHLEDLARRLAAMRAGEELRPWPSPDQDYVPAPLRMGVEPAVRDAYLADVIARVKRHTNYPDDATRKRALLSWSPEYEHLPESHVAALWVLAEIPADEFWAPALARKGGLTARDALAILADQIRQRRRRRKVKQARARAG